MEWLTEDASLICQHGGRVSNNPSQDLVRVSGRKVLVDADPESRSISACPNIGATMKPCTLTLAVKEGYSDFVRVEGKRVCLRTVTGLTDGTLPGMVTYLVAQPGQSLVWEG